MLKDYTGMPLEKALLALQKQGINPHVTYTRAPLRRGQTEADVPTGEMRVFAVRGDTLIAARFLTGAPKEGKDE